MNKKEIKTDKAPSAIGPYSQALKVGDFIFVSGQIPLIPGTSIIPEGIEAQTERALENVKAVLESEGADMSDIVEVTVFLTDMNNFQAMNKVYAGFFSEPYPARAAVQAAALPKNVLVEIKVTAVV